MTTLTLQKPLHTGKPWYREPWPWLLMSGPLIVVVAALFTAWIAYTYADPLVSNDYYRKGLAAGQTIASSERATALGLQAHVNFVGDKVELRLTSTEHKFALPDSLVLTLSHPTRAGLDQTRILEKQGANYVATLPMPKSGHWLLMVSDDIQSWRLLGKIVLPADQALTIGGDLAVADIRQR